MHVSHLIPSFRSLLLTAALASSVVALPAQAEPARAAVGQTAVTQQAVVPQSGKINLNTADAQLLADQLNGVGLKKAAAIVAYREQNGPFKAIEDLVNVPGIGEATVAKNKDILSVN